MYGAGDEARTRYLHLGKVALYRMSYTRICRIYYTHKSCICQAFFKNFFKNLKVSLLPWFSGICGGLFC